MKSNLKQLRELYGVTHTDIAKALTLHRQTPWAIETERYEPSISIAMQIAMFFNLGVGDVFFMKEEDIRTPTYKDPEVIAKVNAIPREPEKKRRSWFGF